MQEHLAQIEAALDPIALEEVDSLYEDQSVPLPAVSDALSDARAVEQWLVTPA